MKLGVKHLSCHSTHFSSSAHDALPLVQAVPAKHLHLSACIAQGAAGHGTAQQASKLCLTCHKDFERLLPSFEPADMLHGAIDHFFIEATCQPAGEKALVDKGAGEQEVVPSDRGVTHPPRLHR